MGLTAGGGGGSTSEEHCGRAASCRIEPARAGAVCFSTRARPQPVAASALIDLALITADTPVWFEMPLEGSVPRAAAEGHGH